MRAVYLFLPQTANRRTALLHLKQIGIPFLFILPSCGHVLSDRCEYGQSISPSKLRDVVIEKLVIESKSQSINGLQKYSSSDDFLKINENCCYIQGISGEGMNKIPIPIDQKIVLVVIYKKLSS